MLDRLFPQQRDFVEDPTRRKIALCPRRSGKSYSLLVYALFTALNKPGAKIVIIGKVRKQVRGIYWSQLKKLCKELEIKAHYRNVELEAELPNDSVILFTGADTMEEIEKFRGQFYDFAAIDEVKSFSPPLVKELVQDILQPALLDTRGTLVLIGTPGAVLTGPFYELTTQVRVDGFGTVRPYAERNTPEWTKSNGHMKGANWSFHRWNSSDNIRMPHIWEDAQKDKESNGWDDYHPTWLREYLGQWAPNEDALVYGYARSNQGNRLDYTPNQSSTAPFGLPEGHNWEFVLGLDLGTKDDTAFVVAAWSETHPNLYYVHAEKHVGWDIGPIVSRTKELEKMFGGFLIRVADTGGLGTMVVDSMSSLFGVDFVAAKKSDKPSHIKLLNADLAAARIMVLPSAQELVEEWMTLQWGDPEHLKEDKRAPNHCADAALYVWRFAYHHLWEQEERGPAPGTEAWWEAKQKKDEEAYRDQLLSEQEKEYWETWRDEIQEQDQLWTLLNSQNY